MPLFENILKIQKPLKIIGVINAYVALMAEKRGATCLYLSGAGMANYSWGLPDLGLTTLSEVAEETRRIRSITQLPLVVDIDTGWGNEVMIERSIDTLICSGASAVHLEDQIGLKRCGHRLGKEVVSIEEMKLRLLAAKSGKKDRPLFLIARTDSYEKEGLDGVIKRSQAYQEVGADMIFADALPTLEDFVQLKKSITIPVLINQTEFGVTPLFSYEEIERAKLDAILYPLSLARGMMGTALKILDEIIETGGVQHTLPLMQPRKELYEFLDYENKELGWKKK